MLEIISTLQQAATSAFNKSEREIPLTQQRQSGKDASKITPPTLPAGTRSGLDIGVTVEIAEIDTTSIPEPSAVVGNLAALLSIGMYFAWRRPKEDKSGQ